jgi:His-Xaa-Ser system protein HxsD
MSDKHIVIAPDHARITVNANVYSKETILAAGYVFLDKAFILLDQEAGDKFLVYLYPQKKDDARTLALEFYNELLNYAHYFTRVKANAEAMKSLMQRALFSTAPSLVKEAEEKEIEDLIQELEEEEKNASAAKKRKK